MPAPQTGHNTQCRRNFLRIQQHVCDFTGELWPNIHASNSWNFHRLITLALHRRRNHGAVSLRCTAHSSQHFEKEGASLTSSKLYAPSAPLAAKRLSTPDLWARRTNVCKRERHPVNEASGDQAAPLILCQTIELVNDRHVGGGVHQGPIHW